MFTLLGTCHLHWESVQRASRARRRDTPIGRCPVVKVLAPLVAGVASRIDAGTMMPTPLAVEMSDQGRIDAGAGERRVHHICHAL